MSDTRLQWEIARLERELGIADELTPQPPEWARPGGVVVLPKGWEYVPKDLRPYIDERLFTDGLRPPPLDVGWIEMECLHCGRSDDHTVCFPWRWSWAETYVAAVVLFLAYVMAAHAFGWPMPPGF